MTHIDNAIKQLRAEKLLLDQAIRALEAYQACVNGRTAQNPQTAPLLNEATAHVHC